MEAKVKQVLDATRGAYSFDRYGEAAWVANIEWLLSQRVTPHIAAGVMLSRATRWAADSSPEYPDLQNALRDFYKSGNSAEIIADGSWFHFSKASA